MPLKVYQDDPPNVNLTSMIDVVFLLIIFFMVGTRFTETDKNLAIELPRVTHGNPVSSQNTPRIVSVSRDGQIELDGQRMPLGDITKSLAYAKRNNPQTAVSIRTDASVTAQRVAEVMSAIQQSGVERVSLGVSTTSLQR